MSEPRKGRQFKPDLHDTVGLVGLVMLGVGLWLVTPAAALIVVGGLLLAAGVKGSW